MANGFSKIRGEQIKQGSINGLHIKDGVISSDHLHESAIQAVLESKLIVDYVQLATPLNVESAATSMPIAISNSNAVQPDDLSGLGVLLDKKVIIRNSETGNTIYNPADNHKHEVFGKLSYADGAYTISFGCYEANGDFTPYEVPAGTNLDVQYAQRFTLASVDEMFAANEKFVDGAVDITTALKIKELEASITDLEGKVGDGVDALRSEIQTKLDTLKSELEGQISAAETRLQGQLDTLVAEIGVASTESTPATGIKKDIEDLQTADQDILTKVDKQIHTHKKAIIQITAENAGQLISLPNGEKAPASVDAGNGIYEQGVNVYVNGILQALNVNYTEVKDTEDTTLCTGISFDGESVIDGDIVILEWADLGFVVIAP